MLKAGTDNKQAPNADGAHLVGAPSYRSANVSLTGTKSAPVQMT